MDILQNSTLQYVINRHQQGISLESRNHPGGLTVIIQAVNCNKEDIVDYCIDNNCDVNAYGINGCTALHVAAFWGRLNFVRKLIVDAGADVTITENGGNTALQIAQMTAAGNGGSVERITRRIGAIQVVAQWQAMLDARAERVRQEIEDRMLYALHSATIVNADIQSPGGPIRRRSRRLDARREQARSHTILSYFARENPTMMLPVMSYLTGFPELDEEIRRDGKRKKSKRKKSKRRNRI